MFPHLSSWLLRATALSRRASAADAETKQRFTQEQNARLDALSSDASGETTEQPRSNKASSALSLERNHYKVLGLAHDFTSDQLKRAYRSASLLYHPDKTKSGSPEAFARVGSAHACLSDPAQREGFDLGEGLWAAHASQEDVAQGRAPSLAEEVEELYFPEKVPFWPFGDPLEDHADLRQRRTNQKTSAQARAASDWAASHPEPDLVSLETRSGDSNDDYSESVLP
mmetsp:Transcript_3740/g.8000  ORF Transcript_3740/g.8000 Transcript_3740/m.8000 type:complete len:227 (+) Transcript_3740:332-1012(+)